MLAFCRTHSLNKKTNNSTHTREGHRQKRKSSCCKKLEQPILLVVSSMSHIVDGVDGIRHIAEPRERQAHLSKDTPSPQ